MSIQSLATRMPSLRLVSSGSARNCGALFEMCWHTNFSFAMIDASFSTHFLDAGALGSQRRIVERLAVALDRRLRVLRGVGRIAEHVRPQVEVIDAREEVLRPLRQIVHRDLAVLLPQTERLFVGRAAAVGLEQVALRPARHGEARELLGVGQLARDRRLRGQRVRQQRADGGDAEASLQQEVAAIGGGWVTRVHDSSRHKTGAAGILHQRRRGVQGQGTRLAAPKPQEAQTRTAAKAGARERGERGEGRAVTRV